MRMLLDTSAIAKRYKREAGNDALSGILARADAVLVAAHCRIEIASSLCRELHDGALDLASYADMLEEVARDFADFDVLPVTPEVESRAIVAMQVSRLRAMDALHIGTAQAGRADMFVTADRKQAIAARAVGLATTLIEA